MALVKTTPPEKAEGQLAELYAEVEQMFGMVPNNVRLLGVSPALLENQLQLIGHYMGHATLSTPFLAMTRMLVSKACHSPYCQNLNSGLLLKAGFTKEQVGAMQADPTQAPLDEKQKALLLFVLKACDNPHSVAAEDVDRLGSLGWSEVDIVDAVAHGARMVGTNILFDTFKIDKD
ncbi:MAG: carboxymuconolactone decarboxylase family protein [Desulfomonilaceae bacterium]